MDITDQIANASQFIKKEIMKYLKTGAISVLLKNNNYSIQYNIEAWLYSNRGVPSLYSGAYSRRSLDSYKKVLAQDSSNYNSPDLDSHYDGIGDVFYRRIN